jgi:hypothetical protein
MNHLLTPALKQGQLYMIEIEDLTFMQLFWIVLAIVMFVFFFCNLLNYYWVFEPM